MIIRRYTAALALALLAVFLSIPGGSHAADGTNVIFRNGNWQLAGQVTVPNGGTGLSTATANGVLMGNGTGNFQVSGAGTSGQPFISGGSGAPGGYAALDISTAAVTGTLPLNKGGTNASSGWTANRCVRVNSGGTALEVAGADCGVSLTPILSMTTFGTVTQGNTTHIAPGGAVDSAQGRAQQIAPTALATDNLRCQSSVAPGASQSFTITMADGACTGALTDSTAQICTISGTNRTCQEAGAAEAVSAGECFSFKVVASAGAAEAVVNCETERSS